MEKVSGTAVKVGVTINCRFPTSKSFSLLTGDSGNPLMNYVNVDGKIKAVQIGIVAAGHSECGHGASGFPGIYSDVKFYLDWILDQMEE